MDTLLTREKGVMASSMSALAGRASSGRKGCRGEELLGAWVPVLQSRAVFHFPVVGVRLTTHIHNCIAEIYYNYFNFAEASREDSGGHVRQSAQAAQPPQVPQASMRTRWMPRR